MLLVEHLLEGFELLDVVFGEPDVDLFGADVLEGLA